MHPEQYNKKEEETSSCKPYLVSSSYSYVSGKNYFFLALYL